MAETFGNVMAGLDLAGYEDWVNGKISSATDPRLVRALDVLKTYSTYVNRDHANLDWTVALARVAKGAVGLLRHGRLGQRGLPRGRGSSTAGTTAPSSSPAPGECTG